MTYTRVFNKICFIQWNNSYYCTFAVMCFIVLLKFNTCQQYEVIYLVLVVLTTQ